MTRRKRASLKDKGPEILGLTQKKGKGIDVLFGGPVDDSVKEELMAVPESDEEEVEEIAAEVVNLPPAPEISPDQPDFSPDVAGAPPAALNVEDAAPEPPLAIEVDELGLPVAMDAPPANLELAMPTTETDAFDMSPAPSAAPGSSGVFVADDDLSGLLNQPDIPQAASAPPIPPVANAPAMETAPPPAPEADLPGPTMAPAAEYTFEAPPQTVPVTPPQPAVAYSPVPAPPPPPSTLTAARPIVESLGGIITERVQTLAQDLLPADVQERETVSNVLDLRQRAQLEHDEGLTARVTRYVGRERRENLDKEIERLYDLVASELSTSKEDAEFALRTLSEAQDIVLEDTRQYDEALYRVAVVKTMLARKQNLRRWSYSYGLGVFFYAVLWLAALISGILLTDYLGSVMGETGQGLSTVVGAWFSALAGGIGGIIGIFYSLYWHVAMKQDFDRQYVMYYIVQPIMGFVLGALIYFIVLAGYLFFNLSTPTESPGTITSIGLVLGFVAGFRQRVVFEMLDRIVKKLLPRDKEEPDESPVSLIPGEFKEN